MLIFGIKNSAAELRHPDPQVSAWRFEITPAM